MKRSTILLLACCAATLVVVALRGTSPATAGVTYKAKSLTVHGPYPLPAEDIGGLPPVILTEARDDEPGLVEQNPVTFTDVPPTSAQPAPKPTSKPFTPFGLQQFDAQVAASDGYLILATGQNMLFYSKDGHPLESKYTGDTIGVITSAQFFGNAQMQQDIKNSLNLPPQYASLNWVTYIDLRVRFDHYRKRFWIISEWNNKFAYVPAVEAGDGFARYARRNRIVAGVSKTQDPRDGFWLYWWEGLPDDGACNAVPDGTSLVLCPGSDFAPGDASDFPYLGFSADHAIQTIHYNNMWPKVLDPEAPNAKRGVVANLLPAEAMAKGFAGAGVPFAWSYWDITNDFGEQVTSVIMAADGHPSGDPGDRGYLARLVRKEGVSGYPGSNLFLNYWAIIPGSPPILQSAVAPMTSALGGGVLPQPGTTELIPVGSAYHTVFRNGRLYLAFTERTPLVAALDDAGNPITWTRVRFIGVGVASAAVEIDRTIDVQDSGAGSFTAKGFPEIQVNSDGRIAVVYMAAGLPNVLQGAYYNVYYPSADLLSDRRTLHQGEGVITIDDDVDHGGTALDPFDNESIWMAHFYATSNDTYRYVVGKVFGNTLADLFSRRITLSTNTTLPGGAFEIDVQVRNQGDGHSIGTRAAVYLSVDDVISTDDQVVGEFTIPAIQSGDQRVITTKLRLPSGIAEGTYSIGVILDPDKRLREYLLDNNASAGSPRLRVLSQPSRGGSR